MGANILRAGAGQQGGAAQGVVPTAIRSITWVGGGGSGEVGPAGLHENSAPGHGLAGRRQQSAILFVRAIVAYIQAVLGEVGPA